MAVASPPELQLKQRRQHPGWYGTSAARRTYKGASLEDVTADGSQLSRQSTMNSIVGFAPQCCQLAQLHRGLFLQIFAFGRRLRSFQARELRRLDVTLDP